MSAEAQLLNLKDTIPLYTRSSDAGWAVLGNNCEMQYLLTFLIPEKDYPEPLWFIAGTAFHQVVEDVINDDLDLDQALMAGEFELMRGLDQVRKRGVIESKTRTLETYQDDMNEWLTNWFDDVHPHSATRMPEYEDYDWPPKTEHIIDLKNTPLGTVGMKTTVDAIFEGGPKGRQIAIVDWKTGVLGKAHDWQIQCYAYGLKCEGLMSMTQNRSLGWFHHVYKQKIQKVSSYWGEAIPSIIRRIERRKRELMALGDATPNPDWWCDSCAVKPFCPTKGAKDTRLTHKQISQLLTAAQGVWRSDTPDDTVPEPL